MYIPEVMQRSYYEENGAANNSVYSCINCKVGCSWKVNWLAGATFLFVYAFQYFRGKDNYTLLPFCGMQKFLWLPKNFRTPRHFQLKALSVKHTIYTWLISSKSIWRLTYLKANRRIHGTLHTLPKSPPPIDVGDWLTVG